MIITRLFWLSLWIGCALHSAAAEFDPAALATRVRQYIEAPRFARSLWGIQVVSLETGRVWVDSNANKLMKPASNAKLFTAGLALDRLGPDYRFTTTIFYEGKLSSGGTLRGNLIVYGRGDPSLAARFNEDRPQASLDPLVRAIKDAGLRRIDGDLVGDESYFRGPSLGRGWTWDDLQYSYGAAVSALTADDNVVDLDVQPGPGVGAAASVGAQPASSDLIISNQVITVETGGKPHLEVSRALGARVVYVFGQIPLQSDPLRESVTVQDPARSLLLELRAAMAKAEIKVRGNIRTLDWRDRETRPVEVEHWTELAQVKGRSLSEILPHMLKPSQNLYAQLLWLTVGAERQHKDATLALLTTEEASMSEMSKFAREVGVTEEELFLEDGAGLSRGALVTPQAIVSLLRYMDKHRCAELFKASLPVAGQDGTLRGRFLGTPAQGRVRAKTGSLRFVHTLSGYATAANGERLAFSIMLNNQPSAPDRSPREDVDAIAVMLCAPEGGG